MLHSIPGDEVIDRCLQRLSDTVNTILRLDVVSRNPIQFDKCNRRSGGPIPPDTRRMDIPDEYPDLLVVGELVHRLLSLPPRHASIYQNRLLLEVGVERTQHLLVDTEQDDLLVSLLQPI